MGGSKSTIQPHSNASVPSDTRQSAKSVLVVEPEALLRWSLTTYLGRWFQVFSTESGPAANQILNGRAVDAAILSDDLLNHDADELEAAVRSRNSSARVIRTISHPSNGDLGERATTYLEKPFELARLAELLGIKDPCP